jgi:hypothetical protein
MGTTIFKKEGVRARKDQEKIKRKRN